MSNKVLVITGAARRIGAALARAFHADGFDLLLHYHNSQKEALSLAKELNKCRPNSVICTPGDLSDKNCIQAIAELVCSTWGRCDVLINNASAFYPTPLNICDTAQWDDLMASNLKGPFFLSLALHAQLKNSRGCIVNIADINGFQALAKHPIYCIAKAGNIMMTKSLALEMAPEVRVNGVAPGAILWPEEQKDAESVDLQKLASIPLGKLGGVESIVATVRLLINDASYLNGEVITVDGGKSIVNHSTKI